MFTVPKSKGSKIDFFGIIILILSIYVLSVLFIDPLFTLDPEISAILSITDNFVCAAFFMEFVVRFYKAESKLQFMKWGWIDLVSSIPTVEYLRIGRIFSLFRLLRIVRAVRSTKELIQHFRKNRVESTVASMAIVGVLLLIFSSILILKVEDVPGGNIKNANDALWWAFFRFFVIFCFMDLLSEPKYSSKVFGRRI